MDPRTKRELVVVTNGLLVATALADAPGISVLVTGGMLRLSAMSLVGDLGTDVLRSCALSGGDDYELVFTAPTAARAAVEKAGKESVTRVTRIGRIEAEAGLRIVDASGAPVTQRFGSFDHFG